MFYETNLYMGVEPKIGVVLPPQIIHFNRVFHEINHPFWGFPPIFGSTPIYNSRITGYLFFDPLYIGSTSPPPRMPLVNEGLGTGIPGISEQKCHPHPGGISSLA